MITKNRNDLDKKYGIMTISKLLKAYRLTEELTQVELAEKLGWSKGNLCDVENGRRGVGFERAELIAKQLHFPLEYILEITINEQLDRAGLHYHFKITEKNKKTA